jgi:triosephosphate isomerase (TIM)
VGAEPRGAFTGEIAAGMLEGLASYVIVGHSERRQFFCEDDALVNRKVKAALGAGLVPIVCLGETLEQHERDETHAVVTRQVRAALEGVDHVSAVVIAYEPIWAIGTGRPATPEGCNATLAVIRQTVAEIAGSAIADGLQLQYGGSVTPDNFAGFIAQPDVDGALVGGASLKADQFVAIVRIAAQLD